MTKMRRLTILFLVIYILPVHIPDVFSQKNIKGIVFEQLTPDAPEVRMAYATVLLLNEKDSTTLKSASTDDQGEFLFSSVKTGNYLLSVSFIGYHTFWATIRSDQFKNKEIDLGKIQLKENSVLLSEVTITAQIPEVVAKEDTLEYNTDAFRMQEGAVAEDLLKRLPGVEVDAEGNITVVGKKVTKIMVDGKEFFANDPKMATKNLTLDIIDKVQVVDKKSDAELLTGVADGEEETIINFTIKKGMKKGWMANLTGGAGAFADNPTDNSARYSINSMVNRFWGENRVSLILNSNNINNRDGGGGSGNGIANSTTTGINVAVEPNEKLRIDGDVAYNYADESVRSKSFRQNILVDSISYRESESDERRYSNNMAFNGKLEYKPDTLNTFVLNARLSYNRSDSRDYSYQSTLAGDPDSTRVNSSESNSYLSNSGWTGNIEMTYSRRFLKRGRRFNISGSINLNNSTGTGTTTSSSEFYLQPDRNLYLNQEKQNTSNSNAYNMRISYIEPVWKTNNTLQFSYNIRYNRTTNIRETFDYDEYSDTYSLLNPDYSRSLENNFVNQNLRMSFNAVHTNYSYNIGINVVPTYTQSTSYVKGWYENGNDSILNKIDGRNVINYSPQANFTYRFDKQKNLRFRYRGNMRQPSVNQLDPTPNNNNPLNISSGNPDLLPSFIHDISLRYNNNQRESQRSLTGYLNFSFVQNEIINYTDYEEETGVQYTTPINENGSWNASGNVMYNLPLDRKKKLRFTTESQLSYNNNIGFIKIGNQSERNISGTFGIRERIGLSYSRDWFYGQLRANVRYSNTSNTIEGREDQSNTNFGMTYNTQLFLPKNWTFASDINFRATRGLSTGYNTNELLWNAEISKQFMKQKQASLKFRWNDILQQTLNIRRNINANYIEDSEYNTLTSFFLVTFTYRFNQMGGRKNQETGKGNQEYNRF